MTPAQRQVVDHAKRNNAPAPRFPCWARLCPSNIAEQCNLTMLWEKCQIRNKNKCAKCAQVGEK